MIIARNAAYEMLENMRIDRDRWRETVREVYDMCHLRDEMAMDVVDLIEQRHAAFFGAERHDDTP